MENVLARWRRELRGTFSANSPTVPQWERDLEKGDDGGYFAPESAAWAVHGSMTPVVAGIQALLLQALHPGAMAGVHDHSDYASDPLSRLAGTIRWIFTVTYGDTAAAQAASSKVRRIHTHISGTYQANPGTPAAYTANDPELLRWVHLAFTEAFLACHQALGRPIPGGADAYVADWAVAGHLMGVPDPPMTMAGLDRQLAGFRQELRCDERVQETVEFLKRPPLPRSQQLGYKVLFATAVATLDPRYRTLLGLHAPHVGPVQLPVRWAAKVVLGVVHLGLGKTGPSEQSARARRCRLGLDRPAHG
ncbi:oxygenase MpaB family protein [Arthrobacter sp. SDTb3-6]|uniref:oxygenase MpaB family protein n=1 Tax=Arthrobacter sp. SDTb3-6 TaxID=2713571 RepID=UPI00159E8F92|nr:oxygenase MpaB family protein [Arthrobacter sp. SDTb3-6]NVN00119.1 DUF2236 domain-containing protein [Arthrobacter sp. SDTb3-6]